MGVAPQLIHHGLLGLTGFWPAYCGIDPLIDLDYFTAPCSVHIVGLCWTVVNCGVTVNSGVLGKNTNYV